MVGTLLGCGAVGFDSSPGVRVNVQGVQVVEVFPSVASPKDVDFSLVGEKVGRVHVAGTGWGALDSGLVPPETQCGRHVQDVHVRGGQRTRTQPTTNNNDPAVIFILRIRCQCGRVTVPARRRCTRNHQSVRRIVTTSRRGGSSKTRRCEMTMVMVVVMMVVVAMVMMMMVKMVWRKRSGVHVRVHG